MKVRITRNLGSDLCRELGNIEAMSENSEHELDESLAQSLIGRKLAEPLIRAVPAAKRDSRPAIKETPAAFAPAVEFPSAPELDPPRQDDLPKSEKRK